MKFLSDPRLVAFLRGGHQAIRVSGKLKRNQVPSRVLGMMAATKGRDWHVLTLFADRHEGSAKTATEVLKSIRVQ